MIVDGSDNFDLYKMMLSINYYHVVHDITSLKFAQNEIPEIYFSTRVFDQ